MSRQVKLGIGVVLGVVAILLVSFYVSSHDLAVLNPEGLVGQKQRDLIIIATLLCLIVVLPVFILTFMIAWKYRAGNTKATYTPDWDHDTRLETLWWGVPIVIILILSVITWKSSHDLDPYRPLDSSVKPLRVQVIALQWKWLFIYPDQQIASVNYLQIPERTPINFEITADAPMNAFWIPKLGSQVYAMAGMTTKLHLIANQQGSYTGSSANISGKGFADMKFETRSTSREDFDIWTNSVIGGAESLTDERYTVLAKPGVPKQPSQYILDGSDLYDRVVMKYMMPMDDTHEHKEVKSHDH